MKASVSSYSFSQLLRSGEHTPLSLIALAKEMGFEAIEFTDLNPPEGVAEIEYARALRAEAEKQGMAVAAYTVGANLLSTDIENEIARLKSKVDVAAAMGAPLLRHDAYFAFPENGPKDFDHYFTPVCDAFRRVTEYAETLGVRTTTENHGHICQDSERVERIMLGVDHKNFGWLVDIGNFLCVDESPIDAVRRAAKYAYHVHAKDFYRSDTAEGCFSTRGGNFLKGSPLGRGVVPVAECLHILKDAGYQGCVTIEYEGAEPCREAIAEGLALLKGII